MRLLTPIVRLDAARPIRDLDELAALSPADLDDEEKAHAARLLSASARAQFVARRLALRNELASFTGTRQEEIHYRREPCARCGAAHGRPRAVGFDGCFSTSSTPHVTGLIIEDRPVGIDVEELASRAVVRDVTPLLHPHERTAIAVAHDISPLEGRRVFTQMWVRKEALLKATGEGLTAPLDRDDVSDPTTRPVPGWHIVDVTDDLTRFEGPPTCGAWSIQSDGNGSRVQPQPNSCKRASSMPK